MPNHFDYEIRTLNTDDVDQYNALLRYSFQVTEQELAETGWQDDEIKQSKFPVLERADVLGCFDGDTLISQFAVYPLKMNVYGAVFPTGFVTSVCTYPEYTGHGIMKRLMLQSLTNMRGKGQSLALLYPVLDTALPPSRLGDRLEQNFIYDKGQADTGKGVGTRLCKACQVGEHGFQEPPLRVCRCDARVSVPETRSRGRSTGAGTRTTRTSRSITRSMTNPADIWYYLIKTDIMYIKEMIFLNREAQLGLWEYIRAHESMIDEVRGNTFFSEPIAFEMDDGDIREMIKPYCMGRIVDVVQFFEKYPCDPDEKPVKIAFELDDNMLEWNNGTFVVRFENGHCHVCPHGTHADYSVKMNIATLTALLLGYKTAERLYELERISGSESAIERLDDVLFHKIPYISDYI